MSVHVRYHMTCDACGAYLRDPEYLNNAPPIRAETPERLRELAAVQGWTEATQPGLDVCATCLETEKLYAEAP